MCPRSKCLCTIKCHGGFKRNKWAMYECFGMRALEEYSDSGDSGILFHDDGGSSSSDGEESDNSEAGEDDSSDGGSDDKPEAQTVAKKPAAARLLILKKAREAKMKKKENQQNFAELFGGEEVLATKADVFPQAMRRLDEGWPWTKMRVASCVPCNVKTLSAHQNVWRSLQGRHPVQPNLLGSQSSGEEDEGRTRIHRIKYLKSSDKEHAQKV